MSGYTVAPNNAANSYGAGVVLAGTAITMSPYIVTGAAGTGAAVAGGGFTAVAGTAILTTGGVVVGGVVMMPAVIVTANKVVYTFAPITTGNRFTFAPRPATVMGGNYAAPLPSTVDARSIGELWKDWGDNPGNWEKVKERADPRQPRGGESVREVWRNNETGEEIGVHRKNPPGTRSDGSPRHPHPFPPTSPTPQPEGPQ